jgi:hypothetical protein
MQTFQIESVIGVKVPVTLEADFSSNAAKILVIEGPRLAPMLPSKIELTSESSIRLALGILAELEIKISISIREGKAILLFVDENRNSFGQIEQADF